MQLSLEWLSSYLYSSTIGNKLFRKLGYWSDFRISMWFERLVFSNNGCISNECMAQQCLLSWIAFNLYNQFIIYIVDLKSIISFTALIRKLLVLCEFKSPFLYAALRDTSFKVKYLVIYLELLPISYLRCSEIIYMNLMVKGDSKNIKMQIYRHKLLSPSSSHCCPVKSLLIRL